MIAWGEPLQTLQEVLTALAAGDGHGGEPELISVLAGEETPIGLGELDVAVDGGIELELRHGGQPAYWWLLAAE